MKSPHQTVHEEGGNPRAGRPWAFWFPPRQDLSGFTPASRPSPVGVGGGRLQSGPRGEGLGVLWPMVTPDLVPVS